MQCVGQSTQTHGACTGQNRQLATLLDAHIVMVHTHLGVVGGVESTDGAAHRLGQRSLVVSTALVLQQAAQFHDLGRDDAVGGIAAEELVGVAGAPHGALVVQGGLQGELHAGLELVLMRLAHLDDITGELVTHDGGVLGYIRMHTLVAQRFHQPGRFDQLPADILHDLHRTPFPSSGASSTSAPSTMRPGS